MATEKENVDNFAAAFDALAALGDKPIPLDLGNEKPEADAAAAAEKAATATEAAAGTPTKVETPVVEGAIEDLTPEEKAAAEAGDTAAEEPATPEATAAKVIEDREADLLAKFAKAIKSEEKPAPVTEKAAPTPQVAPLFSDDEAKFLTTFQEEWPDVAKATSVLLRAQAAQLTTHIFAEIAKSIGPRFAALEGLMDTQHEQLIYKLVPDYDAVRDKAIEWAGKQPSYLQPAYNRVISEGTAEEIAGLVSEYHKATGAVQSAPAVPAKQERELSPAAKKAVAALAPVNSKRTEVVTQPSLEDFDAAFAAFSKE